MAGQVWAVSSTGGVMSAQNLSPKVRVELEATTRFRQFCDAKNGSGKKRGDTFHWDIYSKAATAGTTLTETDTVPETNFTIVQGTLTITEAANSIPYTGKLETLSEHDLMAIVKSRLVRDAAECLDNLAKAEFDKCLIQITETTDQSTPVGTFYSTVTNATPTATNNVGLNKVHVGMMYDLLKERNIPPYKGNDYIALAHPSTFRSLKSSLQAMWAYTTEGLADIRVGEIGRFECFRFVEQTNVAKEHFHNGKSNWCFFFGQDTVAEAIANDVEIRAKIPSDYGRSKGIALVTAQLKPCELLGHPNVQTRAISSQAAYAEGSTTIPKGSTPKWVEAQGSGNAGDIVSSAWKHAAVSVN